MPTYAHMHMQLHMHMYAHIHAHSTRIHAHIRAYMHTYMHTYTYAHTDYIYIYIYMQARDPTFAIVFGQLGLLANGRAPNHKERCLAAAGATSSKTLSITGNAANPTSHSRTRGVVKLVICKNVNVSHVDNYLCVSSLNRGPHLHGAKLL